MNIYEQDPQDNLDRTVDFNDFLAVGDTLQTVTWSAAAGVTTSLPAMAPRSASIFVTGGTLGEYYLITCHAVSTSGLTKDRSFMVQIKDA